MNLIRGVKSPCDEEFSLSFYKSDAIYLFNDIELME